MFRSCAILISLLGLALAVSAGCLPDPMQPVDGGTGGTGGTAGTGGTGGTGGVVVAECPPGAVAPEPVVGQIVRTACRNSFNQAVSVFPVTLDVALDCAIAGEPFNATVDADVGPRHDVLAGRSGDPLRSGTLLTVATIQSTQVRIDALAGATCTSGLSVLPDSPTATCVPDDR